MHCCVAYTRQSHIQTHTHTYIHDRTCIHWKFCSQTCNDTCVPGAVALQGGVFVCSMSNCIVHFHRSGVLHCAETVGVSVEFFFCFCVTDVIWHPITVVGCQSIVCSRCSLRCSRSLSSCFNVLLPDTSACHICTFMHAHITCTMCV